MCEGCLNDPCICPGPPREVTFQLCDRFADDKPCVTEHELCSCHMYREGAKVERERIAAWHDEREAYYDDEMLNHPGDTWLRWLRLNERRDEHRVSAHWIRTTP